MCNFHCCSQVSHTLELGGCRLAGHSPYCVGTGSGSKVKWEACRLCVLVQALQLGASFSKEAPNELWAPVPIPAKESFELAPRTRNRATAAITVVMADPGRAGEISGLRSSFETGGSTPKEENYDHVCLAVVRPYSLLNFFCSIYFFNYLIFQLIIFSDRPRLNNFICVRQKYPVCLRICCYATMCFLCKDYYVYLKPFPTYQQTSC